MRITCSNVHDFISNLSDRSVYEDTVYKEVMKPPLNGSPGKYSSDATSFMVSLTVSAVINTDKEGGQSLLICTEQCGIDRINEDSYEGSDKAGLLLDQLKSYCGQAYPKLAVKPGTLDF